MSGSNSIYRDRKKQTSPLTYAVIVSHSDILLKNRRPAPQNIEKGGCSEIWRECNNETNSGLRAVLHVHATSKFSIDRLLGF
jgi:hypothetical protein